MGDSNLETKRMVIVEDDPELRTTLGRLLSGGEEPVFEVHPAASGVEGLALCCSVRPDCVLLDYLLPDIDGLAFLAELAADEGVAPYPVVVLTGRGSLQIDQEAIRLGAQDYLEKGTINASALKRTIRRALDRHRRLREQIEERRRAEETLFALNQTMEEHMEHRAAALRESEARVRAILNTAAEAIVTFNEEGVIQSFNRAAEPLFGYAAEEMIGVNIDRLVPELRRPSGTTQGERIAVRSDGTRFPVEVTLSQLPLGSRQISIVIVRDVTEQKRAAEARQLFLAATSSDIRNALAVIAGYAAALNDGLPEEQARRSLARITSLSLTLSTMMSDIVAHAGLANHDEIYWKPVNVGQLLSDAAREVEARCQQKGLRLVVHDPGEISVVSDKLKLTRILHNVLVNAVRYTSDGSVELSAQMAGAELHIAVKDTGMGIDAEAIPRIFDPYYRHDRAREIEPLGSGLGLATVRRLCDLLGGRVAVESSPGNGTVLTVIIPCNRDANG